MKDILFLLGALTLAHATDAASAGARWLYRHPQGAAGLGVAGLACFGALGALGLSA